MLIRRSQMKQMQFPNCHQGKGTVGCTEVFSLKPGAGGRFRFCHDDTVPPGVSIGEHRHENDTEMYLVLEGTGRIILDGISSDVGPGDVAITGPGHSHGITNTGTMPMRLLVVG